MHTNKVVIQHKLGGEIEFVDTDSGLAGFGFAAATVANLYVGPGAAGLVASNWKPLVYTASGTVPLSLATDGQLWYNSVVDEVDILVHNGDDFVGLNYVGAIWFTVHLQVHILEHHLKDHKLQQQHRLHSRMVLH